MEGSGVRATSGDPTLWLKGGSKGTVPIAFRGSPLADWRRAASPT